MHTRPELTAADLRKADLLERIRKRREECAAHLGEALKPVVWADGVRAKWRAAPPLAKLAAVPLGLFVVRKAMPRFGALFGWAPVVANLFRALR